MQMMEHNDAIREEIYKTVAGLSAETLNRKPAEGKWSPIQVMEHLYLMERGITAGIAAALKSGEAAADPKPYRLTLDRSRYIDAPAAFVPTEELLLPADVRARLDQSRAELRALLEASDSSLWAHRVYPHPVFGPMDVAQWVDFIGVHEERHLAQIREALAAC